MEYNMLDIAKEAEFNSKAEAQAIFDYTEMLKKILNSDLEEEVKADIVPVINELISDELNHQTKLHEIYIYLTGIEQAKD